MTGVFAQGPNPDSPEKKADMEEKVWATVVCVLHGMDVT